MKQIAKNTIRAMRNYRKLRDGNWHQREQMCADIGKYIMASLAAVVERQWESEKTAKIIIRDTESRRLSAVRISVVLTN